MADEAVSVNFMHQRIQEVFPGAVVNGIERNSDKIINVKFLLETLEVLYNEYHTDIKRYHTRLLSEYVKKSFFWNENNTYCFYIKTKTAGRAKVSVNKLNPTKDKESPEAYYINPRTHYFNIQKPAPSSIITYTLSSDGTAYTTDTTQITITFSSPLTPALTLDEVFLGGGAQKAPTSTLVGEANDVDYRVTDVIALGNDVTTVHIDRSDVDPQDYCVQTTQNDQSSNIPYGVEYQVATVESNNETVKVAITFNQDVSNLGLVATDFMFSPNIEVLKEFPLDLAVVNSTLLDLSLSYIQTLQSICNCDCDCAITQLSLNYVKDKLAIKNDCNLGRCDCCTADCIDKCTCRCACDCRCHCQDRTACVCNCECQCDCSALGFNCNCQQKLNRCAACDYHNANAYPGALPIEWLAVAPCLQQCTCNCHCPCDCACRWW